MDNFLYAPSINRQDARASRSNRSKRESVSGTVSFSECVCVFAVDYHGGFCL